ncbi:MAG: hypothetical protein Kow00109_23160 [Acidobacteriota bacterium]
MPGSSLGWQPLRAPKRLRVRKLGDPNDHDPPKTDEFLADTPRLKRWNRATDSAHAAPGDGSSGLPQDWPSAKVQRFQRFQLFQRLKPARRSGSGFRVPGSGCRCPPEAGRLARQKQPEAGRLARQKQLDTAETAVVQCHLKPETWNILTSNF